MQTIYPYAILKNDVEDIIFGGKLMLNGKTILITGGTGSFGKCFTKYVLTHSLYCHIILAYVYARASVSCSAYSVNLWYVGHRFANHK